MKNDMGQDVNRDGPTDRAYPIAYTGVVNGGRRWFVGGVEKGGSAMELAGGGSVPSRCEVGAEY